MFNKYVASLFKKRQRMDKEKTFTNIEPETTPGNQNEESLNKKVSSHAITHNATNTLFNISSTDLQEQKDENVEFQEYERRLRQNMKDWKSLYHLVHKDLKLSKQKHPTVDKSILSQEKRDYLDKGENLKNFIRESLLFREQAVLFLEYDYAQFAEMLENLETLYEHKLDLIKSNKIAENLANAKSKVQPNINETL